MMRHKYRSLALVPAICFLSLVAFIPTASADDATSYQRVLEDWSQRIPDLEKSATAETTKEIALMRNWIGQAQAFVANDDLDKIDIFLARIEAMAAFVTVRQQRVFVETNVKNALARLDELDRAIAKAQLEADAMLEKAKKLEAAN